ncbi:MAG TPA: glycosyltransferase family 87 protein [Terracidiphilus sp.]|jgi:hypothetical protein|nr:glycosyltransferase family 87 protein [Terracidiphilus sp.]
MKINPLRMIAAALLLALGAGILAFVAREKNAGARDFIAYWSAGQLLRQGGDPYDAAAVLRLEQTAGFSSSEPLIMRNPPTALFLALPLGYVGANAASVLWMVLLLGCTILSVRLIWQLNGQPPTRTHLLSYCFAPLMECLMAGQLGILLLLGVVLFLTFLRTRPYWAGAALVLCAVKPHLFVLFGVVLILWALSRRAYAVLIGAIAAVAACAVLAYLVDPHAWAQYDQMLHTAGIMQQVVPTWGELLRQLINRNAIWLQFVPEGLGLAWALRYYARRRARWNWMLEGQLVLIVSVLCSPYALLPDEALLLPAVLTGAYLAEETGRSLIPLGIVAIAAMIEVLVNVPMTTIDYIWTAPAWLAWFLYATHNARAASAPTEVME